MYRQIILNNWIAVGLSWHHNSTWFQWQTVYLTCATFCINDKLFQIYLQLYSDPMFDLYLPFLLTFYIEWWIILYLKKLNHLLHFIFHQFLTHKSQIQVCCKFFYCLKWLNTYSVCDFRKATVTDKYFYVQEIFRHEEVFLL